MATPADAAPVAGVQLIRDRLAPELEFSVVTLLARDASYARMLASFRARGFTEANAEFIAIDNRQGNTLDGFKALRAALPRCRGRYILYVHDDVELEMQGAPELSAMLEALTLRDPKWMVAGNCGYPPRGGTFARMHCHVRSAGWLLDSHHLPARVESLDENFLVLRSDLIVLPSVDLEGFHFFGTDLCLQAELQGGTAYVIPFMLSHHGGGTRDAVFHALRDRFIEKYDRIFAGRVVRTCATVFPLGPFGRIRYRVQKSVFDLRVWLGRQRRAMWPSRQEEPSG